jgi:hypothetical protein
MMGRMGVSHLGVVLCIIVRSPHRERKTNVSSWLFRRCGRRTTVYLDSQVITTILDDM